MYMQFSSWKEWIKKYTKNDKDYNNKNEKPKGEQQDPSSTAPPSSTELLQPSQEIKGKV
jgi:hypothetical protein